MARTIIRLLVALTLLVTGVAATALPANAEAYRYWGYYSWSEDAWTFAMDGPAAAVPADGAVEGWRFAISDEQSTRYPRATGDFEALCASTPPEDGSKRVGVVLDYGTAADAPEGETPPAAQGACVVVAEDASGADVLAEVTELRLDGGLICGISGYPTTGCGDAVDGAAPAGAEEPVELELAAGSTESAGTASWLPVVVGVVAVATLGAAAVVVARRRRVEESSHT